MGFQENNNKNSIISNILRHKRGSLKNKNKYNRNIFNESVAYNNSIISEGSECNLNQKSIDEVNKISSSTVNKKMVSLLSKKAPFELTNVSNKESIVNNQKRSNKNCQ